MKGGVHDRSFKLNPDGNLTRYKTGLTHLLQLHHSLNGSTFYTLSFTQFKKQYFHETYSEDKKKIWNHPHIITPAFLHLGIQDINGINNQYVDAWKLSEEIKNEYIDIG